MFANSRAVFKPKSDALGHQKLACFGKCKGLESRTYTAAAVLPAAPPQERGRARSQVARRRDRAGMGMPSVLRQSYESLWARRFARPPAKSADEGWAVPSNRILLPGPCARRPRTGVMQTARTSSLQFARQRAPLSGHERNARAPSINVDHDGNALTS